MSEPSDVLDVEFTETPREADGESAGGAAESADSTDAGGDKKDTLIQIASARRKRSARIRSTS
jgi:hypothetical protein